MGREKSPPESVEPQLIIFLHVALKDGGLAQLHRVNVRS